MEGGRFGYVPKPPPSCIPLAAIFYKRKWLPKTTVNLPSCNFNWMVGSRTAVTSAAFPRI